MLRRLACAVAMMALCVGMRAQKTAAVPVLMVSDIHFDPFHDPGKLAQLQAAKVGDWEAILSGPDTATQAADFEALQQKCEMRGVDTPMALLTSSLKAERAAMPRPLFVTVSGDLMAHQFSCRFKALEPKASAAELSDFSSKTTAFVALELHKAFAGSPVYLALGNNDSGCGDYEEDAGSVYLKADARAFAADARSAENKAVIAREFPQYGDYDILLPAPMVRTRLIVLQNIFESKNYTTCGGTADASAVVAQMAWLRDELTKARDAHEHVWVMAHIPPGVNAYATIAHGDVCTDGKVSMFLDSPALADTLEEFAGTVKLAIFAHTHMDEMKLLRGGDGAAVPLKQVPSISPVDGNDPSFVIASVDPRTATMVDYTMIAANNKTGVGTVWTKEYTYSSTYKEPDYSAASVEKLMTQFGDGGSGASQSYQNFYFVGGVGLKANLKAAAMRLVWRGYACSMTAMSKGEYKKCACGK